MHYLLDLFKLNCLTLFVLVLGLWIAVLIAKHLLGLLCAATCIYLVEGLGYVYESCGTPIATRHHVWC